MAAADNASDQEKFSKLLSQMEWLEEHADQQFQSQRERIKNKIMQNPLVPIGCLATAVVLGLGLSNFVKGGSRTRSQILMRWRVGLQSATIAALAFGMFYDQYMQSKKNES